MLNVSDIVSDQDLAQAFVIQRFTSTFISGGTQRTPANINATGVISVATSEDLDMTGDANRPTGAMKFWSAATIQLDDQIVWRGTTYTIYFVFPYNDYGFSSAIGKLTGN